MQIIPALIQSKHGSSKKFLLLACAFSLGCAGCVPKNRPAFPVNRLAMNHPVVPQPLDVSLTDPPDIPYALELVPRLVVPRASPARPRIASAPATGGPVATEKHGDPIIAPELSDDQLSAAKSDTQQSLIMAERNLGLVQGKTLNAVQQDMVSKIRGFVDSAREAMKENDWQRARTQAKKAEVLSREFAPNP
jgi:hypothetical protein